MLGLADSGVAAAYLLMIGSTLLCVVYGIAKWNKEGHITREEVEEERAWTSEEIAIDKEMTGEDEP